MMDERDVKQRLRRPWNGRSIQPGIHIGASPPYMSAHSSAFQTKEISQERPAWVWAVTATVGMGLLIFLAQLSDEKRNVAIKAIDRFLDVLKDRMDQATPSG